MATPQKLRTISLLMKIQAGVFPLMIIVGMVFAGAARRRAEEAGEEVAQTGGALRLIFLLLYIAVIVALILWSNKVKAADPTVRGKVIGLEVVVILLSILSLFALGFVQLGLAIAVLVMINSAGAKAALNGSATAAADASNRFDVRNFPQV